MLVAFAVTALLYLWLSRLGMPPHQLLGGCGTLAAERLRRQPTVNYNKTALNDYYNKAIKINKRI